MSSIVIQIQQAPNLEDAREDIEEAYAKAAYDAIDKFYGGQAQQIKQSATQKDNSITVDSFLSAALLTGKPSYDLKGMLTSSKRTRTSKLGEKILAVPIKQENKVVTMTQSSEGWKHPGFPEDKFQQWKDYITTLDVLQVLSQYNQRIYELYFS